MPNSNKAATVGNIKALLSSFSNVLRKYVNGTTVAVNSEGKLALADTAVDNETIGFSDSGQLKIKKVPASAGGSIIDNFMRRTIASLNDGSTRTSWSVAAERSYYLGGKYLYAIGGHACRYHDGAFYLPYICVSENKVYLYISKITADGTESKFASSTSVTVSGYENDYNGIRATPWRDPNNPLSWLFVICGGDGYDTASSGYLSLLKVTASSSGALSISKHESAKFTAWPASGWKSIGWAMAHYDNSKIGGIAVVIGRSESTGLGGQNSYKTMFKVSDEGVISVVGTAGEQLSTSKHYYANGAGYGFFDDSGRFVMPLYNGSTSTGYSWLSPRFNASTGALDSTVAAMTSQYGSTAMAYRYHTGLPYCYNFATASLTMTIYDIDPNALTYSQASKIAFTIGTKLDEFGDSAEGILSVEVGGEDYAVIYEASSAIILKLSDWTGVITGCASTGSGISAGGSSLLPLGAVSEDNTLTMAAATPINGYDVTVYFDQFTFNS